jgi:hypothetical protein
MILIVDDDPVFQEKAQIALAAVHAHGILFADTGKRARWNYWTSSAMRSQS